ncbi:aldehyde dehydrogenase [Thalassotalea psychrophila]|uniref:Aldehyde dehydrogenase n=1 Tax=Thalassotalea psychrophila TaxID=3065647 RepID=A0ABY9TZG2_9GAMM|nr:aldehyde dehydrogenase [Colwelliaceae bacterium SQ149]
MEAIDIDGKVNTRSEAVKCENTNTLEINYAVNIQREYFKTDATVSYEFRLAQLKKLKQAIAQRTEQFAEALHQDLGRPEFEAYFELTVLYDDVKDAISNLKKWMKPTKVTTGLMAQPGRSRIEHAPLGNVLILVPYNYPVALAFQPLIGAIAAGNTVIIKPSEHTPACSAIISELLKTTFDADFVKSIEGGIEATTELLEHKFDHIFFTGSAAVGKIIMAAAAKHLTPVTLELGGKSPTIVNKDCNLEQAVKRILSGKFLNAGQTCIAPDHVYVHQDIKQAFLAKAKEIVLQWYGEDPIASSDYGRIINTRHFQRISSLIPKDKVIVGGQLNAKQNFIAPTILQDITVADEIMQEEIFGPVLPVLEFSDLKDVCQQIEKLPQHPLAMYIFTQNKVFEQTLISKVRCGGVNVNSTLMHAVNPHLPFGGVGQSGMGAYHGKYSFELFSHKKCVLKSATWLDIPLRYAPYGTKVNLLKKLIR